MDEFSTETSTRQRWRKSLCGRLSIIPASVASRMACSHSTAVNKSLTHQAALFCSSIHFGSVIFSSSLALLSSFFLFGSRCDSQTCLCLCVTRMAKTSSRSKRQRGILLPALVSFSELGKSLYSVLYDVGCGMEDQPRSVSFLRDDDGVVLLSLLLLLAYIREKTKANPTASSINIIILS